MTSILEKLYRGEIHPDSIPGPDTEEYHAAVQASNDAHLALMASLNEEQKVLLDKAMNARAEVTDWEDIQLYSEGVRLGMRLMLEALIPSEEVGK